MKKILTFFSAVITIFVLNADDIFALSSSAYTDAAAPADIFFKCDDIQLLSLQGFFMGCTIPLVFAAIYGMYLYKDLMVGSIYIFTRQKSRLKWYVNHCASLLLNSVIYSVGVILSAFFVCCLNHLNVFKLYTVKSIFCVFAAVVICCFQTSLLFNLIITLFGSAIGYISAVCLYLAAAVTAFYTKDIAASALKINSLLVYLHSLYITPSALSFALALSGLAAVILVGYAIIKYADVALNNREV